MKVNSSTGTLTLGPNPARAYLVHDWEEKSWNKHRYVRFDLRQQMLSFTVDISGVKCLCAGCLYLSLMPPPSDETGDNYCGIQTPNGGPNNSTCTEIDLMEANQKAFQTTVHTTRGKDFDGTCNDKGCTVNWGNETHTGSGVPTSSLYGSSPPGKIDTTRPFKVSATVSKEGSLLTTLSQGGVVLTNFNKSAASNPNADSDYFPVATGLPQSAMDATAKGMEHGMVLVVSLWGGFDKLSNWLNGPCDAPYGRCGTAPNIGATMSLSDLKIEKAAAPGAFK
jgi:hypothetical protein